MTLCPLRLTQKNGVPYALEALTGLVAATGTAAAGSKWEGPPHGVVAGHGTGAAHPRLLIVGSGEQLPQVQALIHQYGLEGYCSLEGQLLHEQIGLYLKAADVVVIPSVHATVV